MKKKSSKETHNFQVQIDSDVSRRIREHARSSMRAEVCGVLIGSLNGDLVVVQAAIAGVNAAQGGAHVTFTQETWEHIYQEKDKNYADKKIVGWYHSHPGFGIFLSDHDIFIHENFFSAQHQLAWVFDPHSDEEGCFGWRKGKIKRLPKIIVLTHASLGLDSCPHEPPTSAQASVHLQEANAGSATHLVLPSLNRSKFRWKCALAWLILTLVIISALWLFNQQTLRSISAWRTFVTVGVSGIAAAAVSYYLAMKFRRSNDRQEPGTSMPEFDSRGPSASGKTLKP